MVAVVFVSFIILFVAAHRVKQCVYPSIHYSKVFTYNPENLDRLEFDIPTGSISVHTCPHAKNVTVLVTVGGKTIELMSKIKLTVNETSGALVVAAHGPSFNLQNCQIIHVEVVIPAKSSHLLTLNASTNVGYISLNGESYTFESVTTKVNVGVIKARHVKAIEFSASVYLGKVSGSDLETKNISVKADVGFACVKHVRSQHIAFNVEKGYLRACHVTSSNTTVAKVGMGYGALNDIMSENLLGEIGYGRMWAEPNTKFSGSVSFSSVDGTFDVSASRGLLAPTIVTYEQQNHEVQKVQIPDETPGVTGKGKLDFKAETGTVNIYLRRV